jgi:hypothetical protein
MSDLGTYLIQLGGQLSEAEINTMSPFSMKVEQVGMASTVFSIYTDQSGLVGLVRHLHNRGLTLLSVDRQAKSE